MKRFRFFLGSVLVYVLVALLHTSCESEPLFASGGAGGAAGHGAGSANGMGGRRDASIIDAITDPVAEAQADPIDGTRLRAYYMTGDDGSKYSIYGRWWDSLRMEDCNFLPASDGKLRCLPSASVATLYFVDASCAQPIAAVAPGCAEKYVPRYTVAACYVTQPQEIHPLGAPAAQPAKLYALPIGGSCIQTGVLAGYQYFDVGPEIPPSSFVAGTEAHN